MSRMSSEKDSYDKPSRKVTRILEQMDHGRRNNETSIRLDHPGSPSGQAGCTSNSHSNSPNGRVGPNEQSNSLGELDRMSSQTRRTGELDRTSSPTRPLGELDQLSYLCPVLVSPSFEIGSNLLLFHLDRSPQELVISSKENGIFPRAINSTKGRKGKSKLPLGGVYKDVEVEEARGQFF
ncbi:hypothetical protein YC2023_060797 [Brassica napus]